MKNLFRIPIIVAIVLAILAYSCAPSYVAHDFQKQIATHKTVAVLPFEMLFTGESPVDLCDADITLLKEVESTAFQFSYADEIMNVIGYSDLCIEVQDCSTTNRLLREYGISPTESWNLSSTYLADLLEVEAVLRGRVQMNRLMSDFSSYGMNLEFEVAEVTTDYAVWPWMPVGIVKPTEIHAAYSLIDGELGSVLWSLAYAVDADWRNNTNQIIDRINLKSVRNFPYKIQ